MVTYGFLPMHTPPLVKHSGTGDSRAQPRQGTLIRLSLGLQTCLPMESPGELQKLLMPVTHPPESVTALLWGVAWDSPGDSNMQTHLETARLSQ